MLCSSRLHCRLAQSAKFVLFSVGGFAALPVLSRLAMSSPEPDFCEGSGAEFVGNESAEEEDTAEAVADAVAEPRPGEQPAPAPAGKKGKGKGKSKTPSKPGAAPKQKGEGGQKARTAARQGAKPTEERSLLAE